MCQFLLGTVQLSIGDYFVTKVKMVLVSIPLRYGTTISFVTGVIDFNVSIPLRYGTTYQQYRDNCTWRYVSIPLRYGTTLILPITKLFTVCLRVNSS